MNEPRHIQAFALGVLGAILGGVVGYYLCIWIAQQGFYALVVPGWLLGLGAGFLARRRSVPLAVTCAVLALLLSLFTEWRVNPFIADSSFPYFLANLHRLRPIVMIMIAFGTYLGYSGALVRNVR